jgi:hypothetical protein
MLIRRAYVLFDTAGTARHKEIALSSEPEVERITIAKMLWKTPFSTPHHVSGAREITGP